MQSKLKGVVRKEKKGKTYWYVRLNGKYHPLPGDPSHPRNRAVYNEFIKETTKPVCRTFKDVALAYLNSPYVTTKAKSTQRSYTYYTNRLIELFPADAPIESINKKLVMRAQERMADTPRATNYLLEVARLIFGYAEAMGDIPEGTNPVKGFRRLPEIRAKNRWSYEEEQRFLTWADKNDKILALVFRTGMYTGQRPSDILKMNREQYRDGWLRFVQQKTKAVVELPCPPELKAELEAHLASHSHQKVFVNQRGKQFAYPTFAGRFWAARKELGLEEVNFRDIRRTFATLCAEAGATAQETTAVTGHQIGYSAKILETYTVKTRRQAENAIAKLSEYRKILGTDWELEKNQGEDLALSA